MDIGGARMMTAGSVSYEALLRREQPPVAGLTALGELHLSVTAGGEFLDGRIIQRRVGAAKQGDHPGTLAEPGEHVAQSLERLPPRDDLLVDEADRLADQETTLDIIAARRSHRARADALERVDHGLGVVDGAACR